MVISSWPSARSTREQPDADRRAEHAAGQQHQAERQIDRAPPPIGDRAGERRGRDVACDARDRDRRRNADEDQQRRHQEAAADAEHAGDEPDRQPHGEDQEHVDRQVGDRKVDLHAGGPAGLRGQAPKRHVTHSRGNSDRFGIGSIARMSARNCNSAPRGLIQSRVDAGVDAQVGAAGACARLGRRAAGPRPSRPAAP